MAGETQKTAGALHVHHVRPGETLSGIAQGHGLSLATLLRDNPHISDPNLIRPGEVIRLTGGHHHPAHHHPNRPVGKPFGATRPPHPAPVNSSSPVPGLSGEGFAFIYNHEHDDNSPHLSWPGGSSGVTLGAGYDMGSRSGDQIRRELSAVGLPSEQINACVGGAGLKGHPARDYARAHRDEVDMSDTQEKALLAFELRQAAATVHSAVKAPLTQHQQDALIAFEFNIGDPQFRGSSALRLLNDGDYAGAAEHMKLWNKSGKPLVVMRGLVNRRADEVRLFNTPDRSGTRGALPATPAKGGVPMGRPAGGGTPDRYAEIITRWGNDRIKIDLSQGKIVLLGLRTPRRLTTKGSYDDTLVLIRRSGGSYKNDSFRFNTLPSEQYYDPKYKARGMAPVGGALGEIDSGQTVAYTRGIFVHHKALRADGSQMVKIRRDAHHNHRIDASDPAKMTAGASGMHIHLGGAHNTWSEGCQTLPPDEHGRFFRELDELAPRQTHFHYLVVDHPG